MLTEQEAEEFRIRQLVEVTPANIDAGEVMHVISESTARSLGLPREDFWLFDDERVAVLHRRRALIAEVFLAGVVTVSSMFTLIARYEELSTRPISFFVITGTPALSPMVMPVSSQRTLGVCAGTRP